MHLIVVGDVGFRLSFATRRWPFGNIKGDLRLAYTQKLQSPAARVKAREPYIGAILL